MADQRNPLVDPLPGDCVESGVSPVQVHVHCVREGRVYCGRFARDGVKNATVQVPVDTWRVACALVGARVIQRAEDCDPGILAALRGEHA